MKPSTHSRRTFLRRMATLAGAVAGAGVLKAQDALAGVEGAPLAELMEKYWAEPLVELLNRPRPKFQTVSNKSRKLGMTASSVNFLHIPDYWDE